MFYCDENAKEFTCHISFNDDNKNLIDYFAVDYNSFISQTPSRYSIEVLEDTQILEISKKTIQDLSLQMNIFNQLTEIVNQQINTVMRDTLIDINMLLNTQRYEYFIDYYKNIHQKIPQYIIASFLGITPVALSRLKSKLKLT